MKHFLFLILISSSLFSFYFSDKLPRETIQIVNSFDCFSKDDKIVLYSYVLALKYRMEHLDDRKALLKSNLDYWRLWHLASDIESECYLHYKFDDILEETITPTDKEKKVLKKLRRVEGGIRTDGSSESSERMSKYDEKLRKKLLFDPPKYEIIKKNRLLQDYDLTTLKEYPKMSIPQNVYDSIQKKKLKGIKKDLLLRYAFLKEEMIRKYDEPKKRHKIKQEILYLNECQKYYDIHLQSEFYHNFKRKLANRSATYNNYYPLKQEFLPKEIQTYCEHNISKIKLSTFVVKKDKILKKKKIIIKFKNTKEFISSYQGKSIIKNKMETYLDIVTNKMQTKGKDLTSGLQLLRLSNCFKGEDAEFIKSIFQDIKDNNLKEEFTEKVLESQMWWIMTIGMKIDAEGESKELKHFFDCNQTSNGLMSTTPNTQKSNPKKKSRFSSSDSRNAHFQMSKILKYYAATFENKPTPNMSNKKAIKAGLVSKQMLDKNGKIKVPFGDKLTIKGMPQGGISLNYFNIPKGKLCSDFIHSNKTESIFFNRKTYDGLDYILLNNKKIKVKHYVDEYVQRLCLEEDNNTISFVKEKTIKIHEYKSEKIDSAYENVILLESIKNYKGEDIAISNDNKYIAFNNKLLNAKTLDKITMSKDRYSSYWSIAFSPNSRLLATAEYGRKIIIWNMQNFKKQTSIKIDELSHIASLSFLKDNKTLIAEGGDDCGKVYIINTDNSKVLSTITPKWKQKSKYFKERILSMAYAPKDNKIYLGGTNSKIEIWDIEDILSPRYEGFIEDKTTRRVTALIIDPKDKNILIQGTGKNIKFWDIKNKKILRTLTPDTYGEIENIIISEDYRYLIASGGSVFIWDLNNSKQIDILTGGQGDEVKNMVFIPNSNKFITIGKGSTTLAHMHLWQFKQYISSTSQTGIK